MHWKMASILSLPQCVQRVCNHARTGPVLGRFWHWVVLTNYGVKKTTWEYVLGHRQNNLGPYRPCIVSPTSLRHWVDVAHQLEWQHLYEKTLRHNSPDKKRRHTTICQPLHSDRMPTYCGNAGNGIPTLAQRRLPIPTMRTNAEVGPTLQC